MSTVEIGGEWLTVSQAALRLEISERQARRYAAKLADIDRREAGHGTDEAGHMTGPRPALVRLEAMEVLRESARLRSNQKKQTPDMRPAQAGQTPDTRPSELVIAQAVEAGRTQGYVARDMAREIGDAVTQATAPMLALLETMQNTNAELLKEIADTREEIAAMRADKDSDRAQLAKLEEMIASIETPKPEAVSTVEANKVSVAPESGQQTQAGTSRRGLWARILGTFTESS